MTRALVSFGSKSKFDTRVPYIRYTYLQVESSFLETNSSSSRTFCSPSSSLPCPRYGDISTVQNFHVSKFWRSGTNKIGLLYSYVAAAVCSSRNSALRRLGELCFYVIRRMPGIVVVRFDMGASRGDMGGDQVGALADFFCSSKDLRRRELNLASGILNSLDLNLSVLKVGTKVFIYVFS